MGTRTRWFWKGALIAVLGTFPLAAICVLLFRFPVPFAGYLSGIAAVPYAMVAVVIYGLLGGFLVQAIVGGVAGIIASQFALPAQKRNHLCIGLSLMAASIGVICLAILDQIIGPW